MTARPLRSRLYVPGNKPAWMEKALAYGADALILDLEDAVPEAERDAGRAAVASFIDAHGADHTLFVRIAGAEDLESVVRPGLYGVVIPKVTGVADVEWISGDLDRLEAGQDMPAGDVRITPILETAKGLRDCDAIAEASPRLAYLGALSAKGGDVERALGYRWTPEGTETLMVRSRVLLAARAAGVPNPMTGLWTDVADLDGLAAFAAHSRGLGYEGMDVIHPSHIAPVHAAFTPTDAELTFHRGLVAALDDAASRGSAAVTYDGHMVDTAMAAASRAVLDRYEPPPPKTTSGSGQ
jgi:citrate lyase subunit beta/citryl-CoA lyase